jgi:uncharacterized protein YeaC (DUF1315 family)
MRVYALSLKALVVAMRRIYLTACLILCCASVFGQSAEDSIPSPVKTLSYKQYKAYTDGVDINHLALAAELNHYPEPEKVLTWKKELGLTPVQLTEVKNINTEIHRKMKEMGGMIIKNEKAIDEIFRSRKLTDGDVIFFVNRYGLYEGELRIAILLTYLKMNDILTSEQKEKYQKLLKS